MIEPELLQMAQKIDSGTLPLDPNAYALTVYEGYYKLWRREAANEERERIVALLSDYLLDKLPNDDGEVEPSQPHEWDGLEKAIALIKGKTDDRAKE